MIGYAVIAGILAAFIYLSRSSTRDNRARLRWMFAGFIGRSASLGSPGVNELRWMAPLRPGDDIMLDVEVAEARVSRSRPETGIVTFKGVVRNAAGQALCEMVSPIIVRRRDAAAGQAG